MQKENAQDLGDAVKGGSGCTRGGARVPGERGGTGGGGVWGKVWMAEPRGTPGVKIRKNMSSFHRQSSQRTERTNAGASGWMWRVLAYVLFHRHPFLPHVSPFSPSRMDTSLPFRSSLPPRPGSLFFSSSHSLHLRISAADAVIVRCSSRCIVVRNNDFIKIHARGRRWHGSGSHESEDRRVEGEGEWAGWDARSGRFLWERFFRPVIFFSFFFPENERESSCRAVFGASRFCHTRVTFGDVNFSPDSFSFRSTY